MAATPVLNLSSAPDESLLRVPQRIRRDHLGIDQERNATINCSRTTPSRSNHLISFSVPACDHKDRFVERQPRTTAQSTGLIMVDLVKYYANFPVLPAFMKRGRTGYFQTQVMEEYS
ncbi:hypothetical protein EJB05_31616 [Eragrostis curvula]|uniref:Uncharacterized protein n=1 Tax=Eragrostis curvula TaxID=38414 RepID=A0A5J9UE08_9POAL|nr:hypothetical protein EJB05_31616 [Eragrostis curvula]